MNPREDACWRCIVGTTLDAEGLGLCPGCVEVMRDEHYVKPISRVERAVQGNA
jgi:hypothetical protein